MCKMLSIDTESKDIILSAVRTSDLLVAISYFHLGVNTCQSLSCWKPVPNNGKREGFCLSRHLTSSGPSLTYSLFNPEDSAWHGRF